MLRVRRDENVSAHIHAGSGTLFEGDDRQTIEEMVEHMFTLLGGLFRDAVTNLSRG
jgi:hypothetical protein